MDTSGGVMDQNGEDSVVVQLKEEHPEEEQQPSDQPIMPTENEDLETAVLDATDQTESSSRAKWYLKACQQIGVVPVSSFLCNLSDASLKINHYGVGPLGAKALAIALQNDDIITNLDLEDNELRAEGTRYLMEMLQTNTSIESLNLSSNNLQHEGAYIFSKMLECNENIKCIKLSGNNFDDAAAKYLADSLKGDYVVKELDLSHNNICEAGGEHLGHMLARNIGIEVLNLSWNYLGLRGAVALSAGLKENSTLKQLQLSFCGVTQMGAEALGQALKKNSTLELLDLSFNRINDKDLTLLCQGLAANRSLRVLKLSNNHLSHIGALTLLTTVTNNKKSALEQIDISTVLVREAFLELLKEAHQRCPTLDVRFTVLNSVTRTVSASRIFQKFVQDQNESIMDFFQMLDKEKTMMVSVADFRKAVKEANIPLDQRQLEWLVRKFDKNFTATILYRCTLRDLGDSPSPSSHCSSPLNPILSSVNT